MKASELIAPALDWAVAKCEAFDTRNNYRVWVTIDNGQITFDCYADDWEHAYEQAMLAYPDGKVAATDELPDFNPSINWAQGGPIIEREGISLYLDTNNMWQANLFDGNPAVFGCGVEGETALIAAMRCYVASKLGDEVEIPEELL